MERISFASVAGESLITCDDSLRSLIYTFSSRCNRQIQKPSWSMSNPHAWTRYKDIRPCIWSVGFGTASAIPATAELRYHQKSHHCKADQAGQFDSGVEGLPQPVP